MTIPTPKATALPFDLRALEVFLAVCDCGGMAAAARRLGLSQPAVSQVVADLEARAGVRLFDRAVRPLGLTASGLILRRRGEVLLTEAHRIAPLLRDAEAGRLALVRVGMVDSLLRAATPSLSAHLARVTDQASFRSGLTSSQTDALLTRQLDLFLGSDELSELDGLERWPLLNEPYVLALPCGEAMPDTLALLSASRPLLRFSARSRTGMEIERHLRRLRLDVAQNQEFDTPYGVTAAVAAGRGWAVTTPLCLFEAGLDLPVACHPLPGPGFGRQLTLVARRKEFGRVPRDAARVVRDALLGDVVPALLGLWPWLRPHLLPDTTVAPDG